MMRRCFFVVLCVIGLLPSLSGCSKGTDISGKWKGSMTVIENNKPDKIDISFLLAQNGKSVTGQGEVFHEGKAAGIALEQGIVVGDEISLTGWLPSAPIKFSGKVSGRSMRGQIAIQGFSSVISGTFEMRQQ